MDFRGEDAFAMDLPEPLKMSGTLNFHRLGPSN